MKIVVVGASGVGISLVSKLSQSGHDVILLDTSLENLKLADEFLDIKTVVGDGTSVKILKQIEIESTDLLIAVTNNDSENIMSCYLASKMGCEKRVAQIKSAQSFDNALILTPFDMGIDVVIQPVEQTVEEVNKLLLHPYAMVVEEFFDNRIKVIGLKIKENSLLAGKLLSQIHDLSEKPFQLISVVYKGQQVVYQDQLSQEKFSVGDEFYICVKEEDLERVVFALGFNIEKTKRIFIQGGSAVGLRLAQFLDDKNIQTKILESDLNRSRDLAHLLSNVLVLQGKGTDSVLLKAEGIDSLDCFVSVTDEEETNILSCILAKQLGAKRSMALISQNDYTPLIPSLNVDNIISTRLITIEQILRFVHKGQVMSVFELAENKIEVISFRVNPYSILIGKKMGSHEYQHILPKNVKIVAILNEFGEVQIANEKLTIGANNQVLVCSQVDSVEELERIFV